MRSVPQLSPLLLSTRCKARLAQTRSLAKAASRAPHTGLDALRAWQLSLLCTSKINTNGKRGVGVMLQLGRWEGAQERSNPERAVMAYNSFSRMRRTSA